MGETGAAPGRRRIDRKWLILSAVMLGGFMAPLDGSIVNTVLPDITQYFKSDISIAQWVPTIYLLTISCLILLYGRLGDMIGYRRVYLFGLVAFTMASALCGTSQNIWMLIGLRAVQGLAAGMVMAVSTAIVTAAFPPKERGKAIGIYVISIAVALSLGPTIGGLIAEYASWRYVFFINVPIGIAAFVWSVRIIPRADTHPGQRLDVAGAVTAFVFLAALLLYANRGADWGWGSPAPVALLLTAFVFAGAFLFIEKRSEQPMLNLALFKSQRFSFASISALFNYMALFTVIFLTPFYLAFALHYSILKVGWVMVGTPLATLCFGPASGILSDRFGTRIFAVSGMCVSALGLYLLSGLKESTDALDVFWRLAVVGAGMGLFQSPNNSAIMGSVTPQYLGVASGVIAAMRNVGMVLGIAVAGAVLYGFAPVVASNTAHSLSPGDIHEFLNGLHWAYITGAGFAAMSALTALLAVDRQIQT